MKKVHRLFAVLLFAAMPVLASAQESKFFKQTNEIAEVERDDREVLSLFSMPKDDSNPYYLAVGNLGVGDDIIQVHIDPAFVLFLKVGDTLEEAQAKIEELKALSEQPKGTSMEVLGSLALGYPDESNVETVTATSRPLIITRQVQFSVQRGEYTRATFIQRADLNALLGSVKFYRKLHPNEK